MDDQRQQVVDKLKAANNILVTVSANPSVDQLASAIALTLLLNKLDKHATAVFGGEVPSTIEFLRPEATLEKNTDSLRDFIISLDKSKADKLRYKVEENVVKIFITPYKTSISEHDLEFGQGDFNVDVVVALGVHRQQDLDSAVTAHGRILHDATVISVNNTPNADLGTVHWQDLSASSLAELVAILSGQLGKDLLDNQIATALLTGIVAETSRFSNDKTTPRTMSISADLMASGANQQLVATQLQSSVPTVADNALAAEPPPDDGALAIGHTTPGTGNGTPPAEPVTTQPDAVEPEHAPGPAEDARQQYEPVSRIMSAPPSMGGTLTANAEPDPYEQGQMANPAFSPMPDIPLLSHDNQPDAPPAAASPQATPPPPASVSAPADESLPQQSLQSPPPPPPTSQTLADLEKSVHSPHVEDVDEARRAVEAALGSNLSPSVPPVLQPADSQPEPASAAGIPPAPDQSAYSQSAPFDPTSFLNPSTPSVPDASPQNQGVGRVNEPAPLGMSPADQPFTMPLPPPPPPPGAMPGSGQPAAGAAPPPPPVPPPMMPPFGAA